MPCLEFKMEGNLLYNTIVSILIKKFPEFVSFNNDWSEDLPYDVFGSFSIYLRDRIMSGNIEDELLERSFDFLNVMSRSKDDEVVNLLVVGVLEILADNDKCVKIANKYLSQDAKRLLEQVL